MTTCQLTVQSDSHQAVGFQEFQQNIPSYLWMFHMMENTRAEYHVKTLGQSGKIQNVSLQKRNVFHAHLSCHTHGVGQTTLAQVDSQNLLHIFKGQRI